MGGRGVVGDGLLVVDGRVQCIVRDRVLFHDACGQVGMWTGEHVNR